MSLLMQALKKAENAKQKQGASSAADAAADKKTTAGEEISLTPKELEATTPDTGNLDTLGLELSPVIHNSPPSAQAEPETKPDTHSSFDAPSPAQPGFDAGNNMDAGRSSHSGNDRLDVANRSGTEATSQQLTAKMRLEQQKAAALEEGKRKAEQEKARTVFASKQGNPNRRTLWLAVVGLTVVLLFFGAGYYYLQIGSQGSSTLVKTLPIQSAPDPSASATETAAGSPALDNTVRDNTVREETVQKPAPPVTTRNTAKPGTQSSATSGQRNTEPVSMRRKQPAVAGSENIEFRQTTLDNQVNPALNRAYQSFINGDLSTAQQQYQLVLQQEPNNRDALLGMAAIAVSRNQNQQAGSYYLKLVELDPSDPDAIAGISSLQGGDPFDNESRLKKVLVQNPQAGAILFALGNLYAKQSRWSDAQQSYFRAYSTASNNPEYAFNLAVSLDRLNQEKLALEYYQRALALAQNRPGNFNKAAIQDRIKELQAAAGAG